MIHTMLFDLDGTLLPVDMDDFQKVYYRELAAKFNDIVSAETLIHMINTSLYEMLSNTEEITNEKVFMDKLHSYLHVEEIQEYEKRFWDFYNHEYEKLKDVVYPNKQIQKAVKMLKEKGYELIVATNPMFPRIAIEKRIKWAGFDVDDFKYITSFEHNHYCKPQIKYYQEVLDVNGLDAVNCLMVGNDTVEDMIASTIGINTYLINNHAIQREQAIAPSYQGDYDDFYKFVCELPNIENKEK